MGLALREVGFEAKKNLILKVAADCFYRQGYTGTRIDDITSVLKVTKPFVYYHFNSKLEILEEICGRTSVYAASLAEHARDAEPNLPVAERLANFVGGFSRAVMDEGNFLAIYFREAKHLPPRTQKRFKADRKRFHLALSGLLSEGRESGHFKFDDLSVTEQTVTGMITWMFNWYQPGGKQSPDEIARLMQGLVLNAVGASPRRRLRKSAAGY